MLRFLAVLLPLLLLLLRSCSAQERSVQIAGILELESNLWTEELWDFTTRSLRENWFLEIFPILTMQRSSLQATNIDFVLKNSGCDPTKATQAYWETRQGNSDQLPPNAVIGSFCSGASISLARVATLENVFQVSPVSTSAQLSDVDEFPHFARLLAPDNAQGEVGALVSALRMFGWKRISIISTDKQFAKDLENEFRKLWTSSRDDTTVEYATTVRSKADGSLDEASAMAALRDIPTDHPERNSRIILLSAHSQDAFPILEMAQNMGVQPDTIWVGPSAWIGNTDLLQNVSWIPPNPGFLGVIPHRNEEGKLHQLFLEKMQADQLSEGSQI